MSVAVPAMRPISDLRTNLNEVCDVARETQQPIFMTKNGSACLVVFDSAAYEHQRMHDQYVLKLREAEIEAQYKSDTVSVSDLDKRVNHIISEAKKLAHAKS